MIFRVLHNVACKQNTPTLVVGENKKRRKMKKLMVVMAAIAMSIGAQAAAVNWSATNVKTPVGNPKTGAVTFGDGFAVGDIVLNLYYWDSVNSKEVAIAEDVALTATGTKGQSQALSQKQAGDLKDALGKNIKFILRAEYEDDIGSYSYYGTVTKDVSNAASGQSNVPVAFNMTSSTVGSWTFTASPTPEPTSGLLLLLGVAGLALRRRHA